VVLHREKAIIRIADRINNHLTISTTNIYKYFLVEIIMLYINNGHPSASPKRSLQFLTFLVPMLQRRNAYYMGSYAGAWEPGRQPGKNLPLKSVNRKMKGAKQQYRTKKG